ncbi:MAG TPA: hypothetical protein PKJ24_03635 [Prolixibacteraceae bacterium]|nr:hypothetical protein [Prolixibacteraceae bacterium]HPT31944.1 hypothetical protein [Prolixibacteraceae bacterium]
MKKLIFLLLFTGTMVLSGQGQVNPHAFGLRLGGGSYNGGELSYQQGIGQANRFELDLGAGSSKNHHRFYVAGIYQWNWNITSGLNWYIGPGASVGIYSYNDDPGYLNIAVGGQIGLEYDFSKSGVPILLSLDARPMWDFLGDNPGMGWGAALGIRYVW